MMEKTKCDFCEGELVKKKDVAMHNGIVTEINVEECQNCGEIITTLDEADRVRKILHPPFLKRIRNFFSTQEKQLAIFKGKVL